jgi:membrane protein DedA with SNARE-associated domain
MEATGAETNDEVVPIAHVRPWWAPLTIVAFVALVICTNVANAVWARWVDTNPAALLALSSRQRYLALSVPGGIGVAPYVIIGTLRIAAAFAVCHLAGRAYRDDLLRLFTRYLGLTPEALDAYHQALDKAEVVVIPFFVGSNIVAVLTGIRRTHPLKLAVLLAVGIAGRLALIWWLAKAFEEPLEDFLGVVQRFQWWILIASIVLVVLINVRNYRRGSSQG